MFQFRGMCFREKLVVSFVFISSQRIEGVTKEEP